MSQPTKTTEERWLSCSAAARLLGSTVHRVRNYALSGKLATRVVPGEPVRYSAADVERLAAELTK